MREDKKKAWEISKKKKISNKIDEIKAAEWDIKVPDYKVKGKEWLKSQVSRAFLPKYFPNYDKYLWIDCDAWVNDWNCIELYLKACENGKLGITQTIGPGYKITSKVNWLIGKLAIIKSQNFKHACLKFCDLIIANFPISQLTFEVILYPGPIVWVIPSLPFSHAFKYNSIQFQSLTQASQSIHKYLS